MGMINEEKREQRLESLILKRKTAEKQSKPLKNSHGGARKGSGQKKRPPSKRSKHVNFYPKHEKIAEMGGEKAFKEYIIARYENYQKEKDLFE